MVSTHVDDEMTVLVIRFINSDDFVGRAIDWVTFSQWDHAEFGTPEGTWIGAHAGAGVQERPADYCKPSRERRYAVPVKKAQLARIMAFARAKIGTPYNYLDILGLFIHHNMSTPGREICSMFVTEGMMFGGVDPLNVQPGYTNLITPEELHLSLRFRGRCTYSFPPVAKTA